jgi:hypothetical protein
MNQNDKQQLEESIDKKFRIELIIPNGVIG